MDGPRIEGDHLGYIHRSRSENRWIVFKDHAELRRSISDQKHGGPAGSLRIALAYRDDHVDDVSKYRADRDLDEEALASVVSGIFYVESEKGPYFKAQWKEDGRQVGRSRSISYHGKTQALRQVARLRYEAKEKDIQGVSWQQFWEEAKERFL